MVVFDNTGKKYDIKKVLGADNRLDVEKYKTYGPPFYTGANVFGQGVGYQSS